MERLELGGCMILRVELDGFLSFLLDSFVLFCFLLVACFRRFVLYVLHL